MKKILPIIALILVLHVNAQEPRPTYNNTGNVHILYDSKYDAKQNGGNGKVDTSKLTRKTISQEISIPKALDILIDMTCDLTIKTWNDNKVKIETTVQYDGPNELTDEQWLEKVGISVRQFGTTIRAKCKTGGYFNFRNGSGKQNNLSVYNGNGMWAGFINGERPVTLYIPSQSALEIENKYGRLTLSGNIKKLALDNDNGFITAANIDQLQLRGLLGSFTAGIIGDGDIGVTHARISLKELSKGVLAGRYNTIEIEKAGDIKLSSNSDDMDIDNAGSLSGVKNYGSLLVNTSGNIDLEGINSNIKLRSILPSAGTVRIVNRNADLRLPVQDLKNYSIEIQGSFNTLFSSFAESMHVDTLTTKEIDNIKAKFDAIFEASRKIAGTNTFGSTFTVKVDGMSQSSTAFGTSSVGTTLTGMGGFQSFNNNFKYTVKVGNTANPTKFDITCANCTLDFK